MFGGFEQQYEEPSRKRWFASTGTSLVIVILFGIGFIVLSRQVVQKMGADAPIDVTFQATPEPIEKPKPPPVAPPVAPKMKRPGRTAPTQPTAIPEERPDEATPTGDRQVAGEPEEYGDGPGSAAAAPPPPPPPPLPVVRDPDPIHETDPGVTAARAHDANAMPVYPEAARKKGIEAIVLLKIHISTTGEVVRVELVRGDEPFASAAIAAVKTWHYSPALVDGQPIKVARLVKIPFRLHS